jgi:hypothetical protein
LVTLLVTLSGGCDKEKKAKEDKDDMTIVIEADRTEIESKEQALQKERVEIEDQWKALDAERDGLMVAKEEIKDKAQLKRLVTQMRDVIERERKMRKREEALEKKLDELSKSKSSLLDRVAASGGGLDTGARIAARERAAAVREKAVGVREADFARREKELAEREADIARREAALMRNQASLAATRIPAMPRVASRGSLPPVSASRVSKKYKVVLKKMRRRGILRADLPLESAGLPREIEAAKKEGDFSKMMDLVEQLDAILGATKVNAGFIERKFNRMDKLTKAKQPKGADKQRVSSLLRKATQLYADGKFAKANAELNKINALLTK